MTTERENLMPLKPPPSLGKTVDDVMMAFKGASVQWRGLAAVEAAVILTDAGTPRAYRWMTNDRMETVLGVSVLDGWGVREATEAEQDELEIAVAKGWVQIEMKGRIASVTRVLHQATGNSLE